MGNQMRKIREEKGLTLRYIAYKTGLSEGYLCHLEKGKRRNPSMEVMKKIANALGKSILDVFFEE